MHYHQDPSPSTEREEAFRDSATTTNTTTNTTLILQRLYTSHFLSAWNSRIFEFGAVLFIIDLTPNTLLYSSVYALIRALAAVLLSSRIGLLVDGSISSSSGHDRLSLIRASILWQRIPVAVSCGLFSILLLTGKRDGWVFLGCFGLSVVLACVEKLASILNTVSVERDWVIVVAGGLKTERRQLNAVMRRIDLVCKLVTPVIVSLAQLHSTLAAVLLVLGMTLCSALLEYYAIVRVYNAVPELSVKGGSLQMYDAVTSSSPDPPTMTIRPNMNYFARLRRSIIEPWIAYCASRAFLASFSLSLLYLTVLSSGTQWQAYMLSVGFSALAISMFRVGAVVSELGATCIAPVLMEKIGDIRAGLWSINWQVIALAGAVCAFIQFQARPSIAGQILTVGIILSRIGLFSFDLAVQNLVQEATPEDQRGQFSASEMALQNFFELLAFASTVVFSRPDQFVTPILISFGAVVIAACCFAAFVRKERGHLLHLSTCIKASDKYQELHQQELSNIEDA